MPGKASNYSAMLKSFSHQLNKKMIIRNSVLLNLTVWKSIMEKIPFIFYLSELFLSLIPVLGMMITLSLHNPTVSFKYFILVRSRTDLSFQAWLIHSFNIHVLSSYSVPGSARCNKGIRHSSCSLEIYILVIRQKEKKKSLCPLQRQENKNPTFRDISHL